MRPHHNESLHSEKSPPFFKPSASPNGNGKKREPPTHQRNLRDYFLMVRERWFHGFATAAILVGLLAFYQLRQPRLFEATASLMFETANPQVVDIKEVVDTSIQTGTVDTSLQTHIGQIQSNSFFNYVAGTFSQEETEKIQKPYLVPEEPPPHLGNIVYPGINVLLNRGTYIVTISSRHRNPEVAALIANRYATKYIEYNRERTASGNYSAVAFLEGQERELLEEVAEDEEALQDFRRANNLVSLEENQNIVVRRLSALSAQVVEARVARLALDSQLEHVEKYLLDDESLLEINFIANYGSVPDLRIQLDKLEGERALLEERYLENHPRMIENTSSLENARRQLRANTQNAVTELLSRHQEAVNHEAKLEEELAAAEEESLQLEEIAAAYQVLNRQAESSRHAYARIVDRLSETTISSQLDNINIRMVDTANPPTKPVEPNLKKIILQSAFLSCFIFIGLPLGLGMLDRKLKAAWEVELLLGMPLLGEIPRITSLKKRDRPHIISQGKEHSACEAFKGIYSQLQLKTPITEPCTILFTSTVPGEGKSLVTSNLAATFANHGKKALLIDCDFRCPALHYYYERKNDRGVIPWLEMDEVDIRSLHAEEALDILPLGHKLHLLRSGGESRNPTEMFNLPRFKELFAALKNEYDVILIDTPPVGIFPDALLLAPMADLVLYVCQFNRVNKTQIHKFIEKVQMAKVEVGGLILNGIPTGRTSTYYDYYGYGQVGNSEYKAYYAQKR